MSLDLSRSFEAELDPLAVIEDALEAGGWAHERDDGDAVQCVAPTRWGDMGALFASREEPAAIHFSVTLDVKPQANRKAAIAELIAFMNERLWLGHFDYWSEEGVILFRHALPMLDRDEPTEGEIRSLMAAAIDAADRFVPALNFVIWAGKSPREAIEAALFETEGEA
ncbi:MAG: YbjN domain-containing protein [Pseudomonadota bacterium]